MRNASSVAAIGTSHDAMTTRHDSERLACRLCMPFVEARARAGKDGDAVVAVVVDQDLRDAARLALGALRRDRCAMPSARHRSSPMRPKSSRADPRDQRNARALARRSDRRVAALAAGLISNRLARSVSPRAIGRGTRETRSAFQLAMQTTSATSLETVAQLVRQPQNGLGKDRHQRERQRSARR